MEFILGSLIFYVSRIECIIGCQRIEYDEKRKEQRGREHLHQSIRLQNHPSSPPIGKGGFLLPSQHSPFISKQGAGSEVELQHSDVFVLRTHAVSDQKEVWI